MKHVWNGILVWVVSFMVGSTVFAQPVVGVVEALDGPSSAFQVIRNGQTLPVNVLAPIYPQDQLIVVPQNCKPNDTCTMTVTLCNQPPLTIQAGQPYPIPQNFVCQQPSRLDRFLNWARAPFTRYQKDWRQQQTLGPQMGGDDEPVSIELPGQEQARMMAGTRPLSLFWYGGKKPYQVRLWREGDPTPLVAQTNLAERQFRQVEVMLTPGKYMVEIRAADQKPVTATFQVMPADDRPPLPAEFGASFQESSQDDQLLITVYAAYLLEEQKAGWEFEAYQLVAPLADDYYPALLVLKQLE